MACDADVVLSQAAPAPPPQLAAEPISPKAAAGSPASKTDADDLAHASVDVDSVAARISPSQKSRNDGDVAFHNNHQLDNSGQQTLSPAPCHRKLKFDADARGLLSETLPPHATCDDFAANDHRFSMSQRQSAPPSATELVALEEAVALAAAAREQQDVEAWVLSQAQGISETNSPPRELRHEASAQRLREQELWGKVNSTILSDLMKSLGSKSIFNR